GNRDGACVQACSVDKSASRSDLRAVGKRGRRPRKRLETRIFGPAHDFARLIREGPWPVNETLLCDRKGQNVSRNGDRARPGQGLVYKTAMPESAPPFDSRGITRRILPWAAVIVHVGAAYLASGGVSLESLVCHSAAIDDFVLSHRLLAVLSYMGLYI